MKYKHLFGPVPSRRLGTSLGVDLVPHKYCSMDCVYCEVGATDNLTLVRDEYVSYDEIVKELRDYLKEKPYLDYITFSGAGEPTLNSRIGDVLKFIKTEYPQYKTALITNSTLLTDKKLRKEIEQINLLLPSLDAVSEEAFVKINRPAECINVNEIIEGLVEFRKESSAKMWLEVFFLPDVNDSKEELKLLKDAITKINPDKVQLNSLDRPGTEKWVTKESDEKLNEIAEFFKPLPAEVITRTAYKGRFPNINTVTEDKILSTIKRRPCTVIDLMSILGLHINEVNKYLAHLELENKIFRTEQETGVFYSAS